VIVNDFFNAEPGRQLCGPQLGLQPPSIRKDKVDMWCEGALEDDVDREEAALRHPLQAHHPNRPALEIHHLCKREK